MVIPGRAKDILAERPDSQGHEVTRGFPAPNHFLGRIIHHELRTDAVVNGNLVGFAINGFYLPGNKA